jgi:hypothetical protein
MSMKPVGRRAAMTLPRRRHDDRGSQAHGQLAEAPVHLDASAVTSDDCAISVRNHASRPFHAGGNTVLSAHAGPPIPEPGTQEERAPESEQDGANMRITNAR